MLNTEYKERIHEIHCTNRLRLLISYLLWSIGYFFTPSLHAPLTNVRFVGIHWNLLFSISLEFNLFRLQNGIVWCEINAMCAEKDNLIFLSLTFMYWSYSGYFFFCCIRR